jgi:MFS family permease
VTFTRLTADGYILFGTRIICMFAYGFLSVVLVLYLAQLGLGQGLIGFLLSLTLIGDAAISLWMTTSADRVGRRRILLAGACLMLFSGVLFAMTDNMALLLVTAIIGVAGGFVVQSLVAYWFHIRFGVEPAALGGIFFGANILAGISALARISHTF